MNIEDKFPKTLPKQHQNIQPGIESEMNPVPIYDLPEYHNNSKRLKGKVAVITGGDSGIGRAVALAFAREGAKICIMYLNEHGDANLTKELVEKSGSECLLISGDIGCEEFCKNSISQVIKTFGAINILINNAAEQHCVNKIEELTKEQLERTFKTNFFSAVYLTKSAVSNMKKGDCIINNTSVVAYKGHELLIDYSATKGALTTFTRSMAISLAKNGIRVNAVAPGPIWTPLIPSSFNEDEVAKFGANTNLGRVGQPVELAEAFVFLASQGASYITGEVIHVNGGEIINA
ncbi:SDR family oxidoreductase [Clostridium tarantellae]|uniref:SDR family oxidoreductase n=1 Tax=Clostridium tarantellae TaxID=39493 RepID=A0A6I1MMW0_9CLOT|nr:SDR family oxidoreductase [Clostridium tarantellae]MPQ44300.1 SDR family oxidoreductase [Clostridium tarantellae]